MENDDLQASLERLRSELGQARFREPAERERVEALLAEIEGHLRSTEGAKPRSAIIGILADAVRRFEVEHPTITACLNEVAAALS